MEDELKGDALHPKVMAWREIDEYRRGPRESISDYIDEMEKKWQWAEGIRVRKIQAEAKAIMMLNRSGCTEQERARILSQCGGL